MLLLALAALAALVLVVSAECPPSFEPLNKTTLIVESPGKPFTWREAAAECRKIAPGFGLLGRDFLGLSKADRVQCRGRPVPLGLRKTAKGDIVWGTANSRFFEVKEEVDDTFLKHLHTETGATTSDLLQIGSLNTATNQWRLVENGTNFTCAICQRAWVTWLGQFNEAEPPRPKPYLSAYTFRLTGGGKVSVGEAISQAVRRFTQSNKTVDVEILEIQENGTLVRMKSSAGTMVLKDVLAAFKKNSYGVEMWEDKTVCPAVMFEDVALPDERVESTCKLDLPGFKVVSRRCVAAPRPDGDYDAVWEADVDIWIDRGAECKSQPTRNALRELQRFAGQPHRNRSAALKSFAKITAVIPKLKWEVVDAKTFYPPRTNFSQALFSALSSLLTDTEQDFSDPGDCYTEDVCALVTGDLRSANDLYTMAFRDAGDSKVLRRKVEANEPHPAIALRIPSKLKISGRVALHTFLARNVREAPLFKPIFNLVVKASMAVVVHVTASIPLAAWMSEGRWPVTFEVDNERSGHTYERFFSVWSLGDSEETTLPCPLIKIVGSVDTFVCTSFQSGSNNFTLGRFVVYHRINSRESDLVRYVDRALPGYIGIPVDETALKVVANFANKLVDDEKTLARRELTSSVTIIGKAREYLEQILHGVILAGPAVTESRRHVKVLVSNLSVVDPVVGFSVDELAGAGDGMVHTVRDRNVSADSVIDVVLGVGTMSSFDRLQILAVTNSESFYVDGALGWFIAKKLMVVNVAVLSKNAPGDTMRNILYLEISVDKARVSSRGSNGGLQVATWNKPARDWSVSSCEKRRSTRGAKLVFRCERLDVSDNALTGRYLVFEPSRFADAVGKPLLAVLIAAGVLSGVSFASIAGTAAALPTWRKDLGHKILLQMALALWLNLALGFASSFVSVDTASIECIAVGVLRHFSYLAMFAWMLVMSGLQLRRLLSVIGTRNTPNLLLKVSFFAWGVPTVSVLCLLVFNKNIYQSVVSDRGFCYPEGVEFVWSVQAPAATVLVLNVAIFLVILARLYGFCGWGETENLQRHMDERTFQVHRLRAVFFTFCLFGIAWVFHLFVEQGVFLKKFVFEYLFLMTASVHVFLLSCMFVFFDRNTRKEWRKVNPTLATSVPLNSIRESSS